MNRARRPPGLTLAELTVVVALFGLFATTALAALNLALAQWKAVGQRVDSASSCRFLVTTLCTELRQGIPNPAPGTSGYQALSPAVAPTAILLPNANQRTSTEIRFTEPNPAVYNPLASGFDPSNPSLYRRIRYSVARGVVTRQVETFNSFGSVASTSTATVISQDQVTLQATWLSSDLISLQVSCTRGNDTTTLTTRVFVIGK